MNKSIITFIVILVLFSTGVFLYFQSSENQLSGENERDFAIENINTIDKIFLASKNGVTVTLTKTEDHWLVNDQYIARKERIETLLNTAKNIQIKNRISKKKVEGVIKNLSSTHIKAEFYIKSKLHKTYFIGGETQGGDGTYMLLIDPETHVNASQPFVTYVRGFQGYLTPRFEPLIDNWRDLKIYHFPKNRIKSVKMDYTNAPQNSFNIEIEDKQYVLKQNGKTIEVKSENIKLYLLNFKTIAAERLVPQVGLGKDIMHRLQASIPYFKLTVVDLSGKSNTVIGYRRNAEIGETNAMGIPIKYDPDRFYGMCFGGKELTILQYYVFDPLLKTVNDF
jgi:hypothetical protein